MLKLSSTKLNIVVSILHQIITAVCGLVMSRIILQAFGSENNGLIQSVSQILEYTVLLEGGIGGVIRVALYKPLAIRDLEQIANIHQTARKMFRKISYVFVLFVLGVGTCLKLVIKTEFDWMYVFWMVLILGASTYFGYYSAISQRLLLMADQKLYIIQFTQIIRVLLNLLMCLLVIKLGGGIHAVKLVSVLAIVLNSLVIRWYAERNYNLSKYSEVKDIQIPQKRDAVIHHFAYFIHNNTDIVLISLFSTLANVSVYSVYRTVIHILEQLLASISSGMSAAIGNLVAREKIEELNQLVNRYEAWNNTLATAVATVCAILIIPFISIYTKGVTGAQYIQPVFAILMIGGSYAFSIRQPFNCVISAAGHYKETNVGAIGEVAINLGLSLLLLKPLGIAGVALGTLAAMSCRTFYTVWYLSKNILKRPMRRFFSRLFCNLAVSLFLIYEVPNWFFVSVPNILELLICAIKVSMVVFPVFIITNLLLSMYILKKDV